MGLIRGSLLQNVYWTSKYLIDLPYMIYGISYTYFWQIQVRLLLGDLIALLNIQLVKQDFDRVHEEMVGTVALLTLQFGCSLFYIRLSTLE